jgi:hypothetical protein
MPIKVTKDGVRVVRSFKSYIGKYVIETINELEEKRSFIKVMDCVGLNGYRNITMWRNEHHIEIICKTDCVDDVISERISPSQASWIVEDIFLYESRPQKGQEFY